MGAPLGVWADPILSNVSQEFRNPGFFAQTLFPRVPVDAISGRIPSLGLERFHRQDTSYFPGGEAREARRSNVNLSVFLTQPHWLKKLVNDTERKNSKAGGLDPELTATNEVTEAIWLELEFAAFNLVNAGSIPSTALAGVNKWSDYVNSDPIAAIEAQKPTILKGATKAASKLALGYDTFITLKNHPKILNRIVYTQRGVITPEILAGLFDVGEVVILDALYDASANAASGIYGSVNAATSPLDFVWSAMALLAYVPESAEVRSPALGYSYWWNDAFGGGGPAIVKYRWEIRNGDFVECRSWYDIKLLRAQAGYLWTTVL